MPNVQQLKLGTRASALARWQANWVAARLAERGVDVKLVPITTRGDAAERSPIGDIGTGVFTKELQRALLEHRIDLAVHSLKDLPTETVKGLALSAVPPRESPFDVLISRTCSVLRDLPPGAVIGTGSLRRQAQLLHARPDLVIHGVRGNVDTRLKKLDAGEYDALVLAEAGLKRLGLAGGVAEVFGPAIMLPAVGQGALGIETRAHDQATIDALAPLDDPETHQAVLAERSLLETLHGGCLAPVGALAQLARGKLHLTAAVLSPDGKQRITASGDGHAHEAESLGRQVAERLISQGAQELIEASRGPQA